MKYTKEERLKIGQQIHESGLSDLNASKLFDICEESARRYRILYEHTAGIEHIHLTTGKASTSSNQLKPSRIIDSNSTDYESMTKDELIHELMESRIREERLKKGYAVKGVGANKEYIILDSWNIK